MLKITACMLSSTHRKKIISHSDFVARLKKTEFLMSNIFEILMHQQRTKARADGRGG